MSDNVELLLNNLSTYHDIYKKSDNFNGPSLDLHIKAMKTSLQKNFTEKNEWIYATLPAWGMHRMGPNGPKMVRLKEYLTSICTLDKKLNQLAQISPTEVFSEPALNIVKEVFNSIRITKNQRILVAVSKVLTHLLPMHFAPIDNQYTLRFSRGVEGIQRHSIPPDQNQQFELFQQIHEKIYYKIMRDIRFKGFSEDPNLVKCLWDSSELKMIDNLIIGFVLANSTAPYARNIPGFD